VLGGLALSAVLLAPSAGAAPPSDSLARATLTGTWIGGFDQDGKNRSAQIAFRATEGGVSGTLTPRFPSGDTAVVQVEALSKGRVRLSTTWAGEWLTLEAPLGEDRLAGRTRGRAGSGNFELRRLGRVTGAELPRCVGDYEIAPGRRLVIGRSLGQLFYLEPGTGRQGAMWPVGEGRFIGGPAHGTSYPIAADVAFTLDADSVAASLTWSPLHGSSASAPRIRLYDEQEVTFRSDTVTLAGTLFLPRTPGPHPGVVLVHGSNVQSRFGQRGVYRFHADHFARRGIAVLAYDKRGIGGSGGNSDDPGLERDALAALRVLGARPEVDPARVGLWGLSQGAWLVGQAAAEAPDEVAFIIPVGGGALHPHLQEISRTAMQMRADGFSEAEVRQATRIQHLKFAYARHRTRWSEYLAAVDSARGKAWLDDPYIGPPVSPDSPAWDFWSRGVAGDTNDPAEYLKRVKCPVLAICGALDTYSDPIATLTLLDLYLQRGGNRDAGTWLIPGASHAIYAAKEGGPREEPTLNAFAPGYLDGVADWILAVKALQRR